MPLLSLLVFEEEVSVERHTRETLPVLDPYRPAGQETLVEEVEPGGQYDPAAHKPLHVAAASPVVFPGDSARLRHAAPMSCRSLSSPPDLPNVPAGHFHGFSPSGQ